MSTHLLRNLASSILVRNSFVGVDEKLVRVCLYFIVDNFDDLVFLFINNKLQKCTNDHCYSVFLKTSVSLVDLRNFTFVLNV